MSGLFSTGPFVTFGPSSFLPAAEKPRVFHTADGKTTRLRSQIRQLTPRRPGVYGMIDAHDELIYVGKAKNLRSRLLSYFLPRSRAPKAGRIVAQSRRILWEVCTGEFASLLRELELIRRWRPRFNVQGQPLRRRQTFVCLGRTPAPYAFLAAHPPRTASSIFGPVPAGRRAAEAVRRLNDHFQLRDCPSAVEIVFPDQGQLFEQLREAGCMRLELQTCVGPCTGGCSRSDYQAQLHQARAFLAGTASDALAPLRQQMAAAAAAQNYERAAALRDRLAPLEWLASRLERLRYARRRLSFIYPVTASDGVQTWYLIHGARTLVAVAAPTDAESKENARRAIDAAFRTERPAWLREAYEYADGMMIVLAWFRKHRTELERTLSPQQALALC
jgi:excinuclease ABC subunit C